MVRLREGGRVAETLGLGFGFHRAVTIFSCSDFRKSGMRKSEQPEGRRGPLTTATNRAEV
jgi:hypothetical protein